MTVRIEDPGAAALIRASAPETKRRIKAALRNLDDAAFRRKSPDIKRLVTPDDVGPVYRLRVADHRIAFILTGRTVRVLRVFHRSQGYEWLRADD